MRPHERLEVWQTAVEFVVTVYRETESFPKEERFGLTSQIRRAAVSIAANIAEGAGRESTKEFNHFLSNAQGSVSELATELLIANKLEFLRKDVYTEMTGTLNSIGRMIVGLARHLKMKANAAHA